MVSRAWKWTSRSVCAALLLSACDGMLGVPAGPERGGEGDEEEQGGVPSDCEGATDPGPQPLSLLSRAQYLQTVRDLFGDVAGLEDTLGASTSQSALGLVQPDVSQVELERYQQAAEQIAHTIASDGARLSAIAPCEGDPTDCARDFVQTFAARAYRAPLEDDADLGRHLAVFEAGLPQGYAHGIELVLRAMLQAPRFLYRVELGSVRVADDAVRLSGDEIAARLSYLVWDGLPDAALRDAAARGELDDVDGVLAQLARMRNDPRGRDLVPRFLTAYLHLDGVERLAKSESLHPEWKRPELRASVRAQAARFFDHVVNEEDGSLEALLTSHTVFADAELASYYGASGLTGFVPLEVDEAHASGMLTLPAFLALAAKPDESSPIYRGKFVREALLCQQLPAPPPNVPKPPEVTPGVSTRERLSQHEVDPACSGCHRLMDPIGFAFEHFDAIGRFRSAEGGEPIDARGELFAAGELDGPFEGVAELGALLAQSPEVEECVSRQWFRFALGRFERDVDACTIDSLVTEFRRRGASLNALPEALVSSPAFLYRRPLSAEVSP